MFCTMSGLSKIWALLQFSDFWFPNVIRYYGFDRLPAKFEVRFGAPNYYELKRKQQFSNVEILSFIGGLLGEFPKAQNSSKLNQNIPGLFTGFSFISATELVYLIVKTSVKGKSSSKVQPFEASARKQIWIIAYLKSFLANSSIHSFIWIAQEKRISQKFVCYIVKSLDGCNNRSFSESSGRWFLFSSSLASNLWPRKCSGNSDPTRLSKHKMELSEVSALWVIPNLMGNILKIDF